MGDQKVRIDAVDWYIVNRVPQPLCPIHQLRMRMIFSSEWNSRLKCEECPKETLLEKSYHREVQYVLDKIDSKIFKGMKVINLDDEAIPLAEEKLKSKDNKYFITALLTESKVGLRLVIYAGKKGKNEKTQIFIEPDIKRMAFDQKDLHPSEVFVKLEGTFRDTTKTSMEKLDSKKDGN